jgi:hypothetical protein
VYRPPYRSVATLVDNGTTIASPVITSKDEAADRKVVISGGTATGDDWTPGARSRHGDGKHLATAGDDPGLGHVRVVGGADVEHFDNCGTSARRRRPARRAIAGESADRGGMRRGP